MTKRASGAVPITAVVVDDEPPARAIVMEYLSGLPGVEVVAECGNGFEAVKAVHELSPDLLVLDVQMPKLDGFEVLELLERAPAVVFTTAYEEYALKAFEVHAVDYLLKPFAAERLAEAVERARRRIARGESQPLTELASGARRARRPLRRILVRDGGRIHVLPVETLDYAEAADDYVRLHAGGRRFAKKQPLGELEELLDPRRFVRIHRGFLLNLDRLARIEPYAKDSRVAFLTDGTRLPVSRAGYARLRELL